jgi:hypothetical protein
MNKQERATKKALPAELQRAIDQAVDHIPEREWNRELRLAQKLAAIAGPYFAWWAIDLCVKHKRPFPDWVAVETEEGPEGVLAVKECVGSPSVGKRVTKGQQDLDKMETVLICMGSKKTYTQWFEEMHRQTATKDKDGKPKEGWSQKTFDRKLKKLKEQGRVIGGGDQGDCYKVVFTEQAERARKEVQPDEPEGSFEEGGVGEESTGTNNRHVTPFKGGDGSDGSFGTDKAPSNHRQNENDGGSSESRTDPDSSVVMSELVSAARQQLKDGK